jgi:hypothetical protein
MRWHFQHEDETMPLQIAETPYPTTRKVSGKIVNGIPHVEIIPDEWYIPMIRRRASHLWVFPNHGLVNMTPHDINIIPEGADEIIIPPSGHILRLNESTHAVAELSGIPLVIKTYGELNMDLPPIGGLLYIVSGLIASNTNRGDFIGVADPIRTKSFDDKDIDIVRHALLDANAPKDVFDSVMRHMTSPNKIIGCRALAIKTNAPIFWKNAMNHVTIYADKVYGDWKATYSDWKDDDGNDDDWKDNGKGR